MDIAEFPGNQETSRTDLESLAVVDQSVMHNVILARLGSFPFGVLVVRGKLLAEVNEVFHVVFRRFGQLHLC